MAERKDKYIKAVGIAVVLIILAVTLILLILFLRTPDKCYTKAAVSADAGVCSTIGRDMLKRNGSAVDAAIAALLCVSLFNPHSMGIGGGVIFNIYNKSTGNVETIDARETAPRNVLINMFLNATPGLFIAVPGELRGYEMAHNRSGKLPWKDLFEPSIKLALEGIQIGKALANAIQQHKEKILASETLRKVFCDSNNNILKEKDTIRFPQLAVTYKKIAEEGADAFYIGSLTQGVLDDIKAAGGIITREDLKGYKPVLSEHALNISVGNFTVYVANAPYGGPVLALILNILKGYNFSSSSVSTTENKILTNHRMIEAFRAAYEMKIKLGDPHYQNITELIQNMTSDTFAEEIRSKIKDNTTQQAAVPNKIVPADSGTSHLSVIAEDGSAVAVTSSINNYFGSKVMSHSTGIIFNDQMRDFSDPELSNRLNKSNLLQPGKRPLSSMSPTIILDKHSRQVKMVVGAAGGPNITTATAQVILNYLFFDNDLQKAVNVPRAHNQFNPNQTFVENGFDQNVIEGLKLRNHIIINVTALANVQAVVQQGGKVCAASDPRKGGYPDGY